MISETGDNLNIVLIVDYLPHHHWMAFLSWYSFNKILPDAKFFVICNRSLMSVGLFEWAKSCDLFFTILKKNSVENHVKYLLDKQLLNYPILTITPEILALRELDENYIKFFDAPRLISKKIQIINQLDSYGTEENLYVDAKENKICPFVSYENGWGKFCLLEWENKNKYPFSPFLKYLRGDVSINEIRINELWNSVTPLFLTLNRN